MPLKEFTGELDKPKFREFTGELDKPRVSIGPIPEGQEMRGAAVFRPGVRFVRGGEWVSGNVPVTEQSIGPLARGEVAQQAEAINQEIPMIERESFRKIANQQRATQVAQFLNTQTAQFTEKVHVFGDAAKQGQQFLREVFEPGEVAIKNTFAKYTEAVGKDAPIPTANLLAAAKEVSESLASRGQSGSLYQRVNRILKKSPGTFTVREFDELYGGIVKESFSASARARGEGDVLLAAITKDLDDFGNLSGASFGDDIAKANSVREQFRELAKIPQLKRLATEIGARNGAKDAQVWMDSLFSSGNGKALAKLRELNAPLYHDLADSWLAFHINEFSRTTTGRMGRVLDGKELRTWFVQNEGKIKEVFSAPQTKAIDNFSLYAQYMSSAAQAADKAISPTEMLFSGGMGSAAALLGKPALLVPTEGAAWVLARGVADPSSSLFKLFTDGFPAATRSAMIRGGQLSGQAAANVGSGE